MIFEQQEKEAARRPVSEAVLRASAALKSLDSALDVAAATGVDPKPAAATPGSSSAGVEAQGPTIAGPAGPAAGIRQAPHQSFAYYPGDELRTGATAVRRAEGDEAPTSAGATFPKLTAEASISGLARENSMLRAEVDGWRATGERVKAREAEIVQLLGRRPYRAAGIPKVPVPAEAASPPRSDAPPVAELLLEKGGSLVEFVNARIRQAPYSIVLVQLGVVVLVFFLVWQFLRGRLPQVLFGREDAKTLLQKAPVPHTYNSVGAAKTPAKSVWRGESSFLGKLRPSNVEISEIYVGNVEGLTAVCSGRVGLTIRMGNGTPLLRTKAVSLSGSPIAHFREAFNVAARPCQEVCRFTLVDQDEVLVEGGNQLAHVELSTEDLIRAALERQQFYRFDLQGKFPGTQDDRRRRPYLAVRLREATEGAAEDMDSTAASWQELDYVEL